MVLRGSAIDVPGQAVGANIQTKSCRDGSMVRLLSLFWETMKKPVHAAYGDVSFS